MEAVKTIDGFIKSEMLGFGDKIYLDTFHTGKIDEVGTLLEVWNRGDKSSTVTYLTETGEKKTTNIAWVVKIEHVLPKDKQKLGKEHFIAIGDEVSVTYNTHDYTGTVMSIKNRWMEVEKQDGEITHLPFHLAEKLTQAKKMKRLIERIKKNTRLINWLKEQAAKPYGAKIVIGLFGTCGGSTWREFFMALYQELGILFYNPQVDDWKPEDAEIEAEHLANDRMILFPITAFVSGKAHCFSCVDESK